MSRVTRRKRSASTAVSRPASSSLKRARKGVLPESRDFQFRVPRNLKMVDFGLGFPKHAKVTHRYHENISMTITTGTPAYFNFRANGMYDPSASTVGHQPLYFDQLAAVYAHWVVIGSKITIFPNNTTTPVNFAVYLNDDSTITPGNLDTIIEQSKCKWTTMQPNAESKVLTMGFSSKDIFGGDPQSMQELRGTAAADPTEQSIFTLGVAPVDLASSATVTASVLIEYIAVWSEVRDIGSS